MPYVAAYVLCCHLCRIGHAKINDGVDGYLGKRLNTELEQGVFARIQERSDNKKT